MNSNNTTKKENEIFNQAKLKNKLELLKSKYILQNILDNLPKNKSLKILKVNKIMQQRLGIDINTYKEYSEIAIEIIPIQNKYGNFININNKEDKKYYHIYFDEKTEEIHRTYLSEGDKVSKIIKL